MVSALTDEESVLAEADAEYAVRSTDVNGTLVATEKRVRFSGNTTLDIAVDKIVETQFFRETWSFAHLVLAFFGFVIGIIALFVPTGGSSDLAAIFNFVGVGILVTTSILSYLYHQSHGLRLQIVTENSSHTFKCQNKSEIGKVYHLIWSRLLRH